MAKIRVSLTDKGFSTLLSGEDGREGEERASDRDREREREQEREIQRERWRERERQAMR